MNQALHHSSTACQLTREFREDALQYAALVNAHGVEIKAFESDALPLFSALVESDKFRALQDLKDAVQSLIECSASGMHRNYNQRVAWKQIQRRKLVVRSDVFEKMGEEDIIEIWDSNGYQLFRSFQLLKHLSYTVEELLSYPFFQLFERTPEIDAQCMSWVNRVLKGEIDETVTPDVPPHVIRERFSQRSKVSLVTPKYISPVKDRTGAIIGFMYSCTARLLEN